MPKQSGGNADGGGDGGSAWVLRGTEPARRSPASEAMRSREVSPLRAGSVATEGEGAGGEADGGGDGGAWVLRGAEPARRSPASEAMRSREGRERGTNGERRRLVGGFAP